MGKALNNTFFYTIGAIIKAMASFLLLPVFSNLLGSAQYGVLNLLQTFSTILATIMTLAVERSLYRLFYDFQVEEQCKFLSSVFWLICINSMVIIVVTMLLSRFVVPYIGDVDVYAIFMPVVLYTFLSAIINFSQIVMQVEQNGKQFLAISLLIVSIYNIVALFLVFFFMPTVQSMVYASFITFFIVAPIAFLKIRKHIRFIIDRHCVYEVFRYSSPMLLMIIFAWVLNFSDRLFIANLSSYESAGVYSLAAKIVSVISLFSGALFQAYGPYFYNLANTLPENVAKPKLKETNYTITLVICLLGIVIILFSNNLLNEFFSTEYESSLVFIYLLTISMIFTQQSGLLNCMIYQNKKTVEVSMVTIASGILSVIFNYFLIPVYGPVFAGFSNLIVGFFLITMTFFIARRNYYIEINIPLLFYSVLFIIICALCDYELTSKWIALITKLILFLVWLLFGIHISLVRLDILKQVKNKMILNFHTQRKDIVL